MSILIQGMFMPKIYEKIVIFNDGSVRVFDEDTSHWTEYKAIEVATPHGDLVDRDDVTNVIINCAFGENVNVDVACPTVIPMEKENKM